MTEAPRAPELVTAAEFARLVGVTRGTVSNWRRRHADFPAPAAGTDSSPLFRLRDALKWMENSGRTDNLTPTERLSLAARTREDPASGYAPLTALVVAAAGMPSDALERIWELQNKPLAAHLREESGIEQSALDWLAANPDRARTALQSITASSAVETLEALQGAESRRIRTGRRVSPWFARLLVDLASAGRGAKPASLLDPASGSGAVLAAASLAGIERLSGEEDDPDERTLCKARLREEAPGTKVSITEHHALRSGRIPDAGFDAVATVIPREGHAWWSADLVMDPRWTYGIPDPTDTELAWIQHSLAQLNPNGRAVLALPPVNSWHASRTMIRRELIRRGVLRCVIAFPVGTGTGLGQTHVWVLQPRNEDGAASVLLLDAMRLLGYETRTHGADLAAKVHKAVSAYFNGNDPGTEAAQVVPIVDLIDGRVDLTPVRQPHGDTAASAWSEQTARVAWLRLRDAVTVLSEHEEPFTLRPADNAPAWSRAALGDLERGGAVEILRVQVKTGNEPETIELRPGDLVFPEVVREPEQVAVVADEPVRLRPRWFVVRADPARIDPWFLAGFLRSEESRRPATTSGTLPRLNPRNILIPLVPLEKQRAYAEVFKHADALRRAARAAAAQTADIERRALDALTGGAFTPPPAAPPVSGRTRHNETDTATVRNGGPSGGQ
ncbi:N-6 DNA methylase [Glycomyces sp. NRRL B-16210]|uniref:N-6 DNA methylase n=1 Tax=Glycomyces sp. NRRL B-16210 TaxID=1463821 RepID=UPI0010CEFEA2|nr:N-6 DNA methylase [Glycomyces sp. NRRL B-16210]